MAIVVQDDTGTVEGANSYLSVADFKAYHSARGASLSAFSDEQIEVALFVATEILDIRHRYVGQRLSEAQPTQWPRRYTDMTFGRIYHRIPVEIPKALAEYAFRALSGALLPDPVRDASGQRLKGREYEVEGKVRENKQFIANSDLELPEIRQADLMLRRARLIRSGAEVDRG